MGGTQYNKSKSTLDPAAVIKFWKNDHLLIALRGSVCSLLNVLLSSSRL